MLAEEISKENRRDSHQTILPSAQHPRQLMIVCSASATFVDMNNHYGDLHDEATVPGFELPKSPDTSYSNMYLGSDELAKEPPLLPPQLQSTLLSNPLAVDTDSPLPQPHNATINHLYIENRDAPRSVVALGVTHRFCSKFVTVVLYKPIQRRGN